MAEKDQKPLMPPEEHTAGSVARKVFDAVVDALPGGGVMSALANAVIPNPGDVARRKWEAEATERINKHDEALSGESVIIEGAALDIARWMARSSSDGLHEPHVSLEEISAKLGFEGQVARIRDAAEELQSYGLVRLTIFGGDDGLIAPTPVLFHKIDPYLMGWNVDIDVVVLAKLCIDENESIVAADLERRSGFERRRFNPAMSKLLEFFDYNDISQEIQPDYPAAYVWLSGATRARLRRLIRKAESE